MQKQEEASQLVIQTESQVDVASTVGVVYGPFGRGQNNLVTRVYP
jgi:hypothetical protein